jgi:hypothetical protein
MATVISAGTDMTLKVNSVDWSDQVSMVELTVDQEVDTYRTLTGKTKIVTGTDGKLKVKFFQDWPGNATGISEKLWALAVAGTAVAFELTINGTGGVKFTGNVIPAYPNVGGTPGSGLEAEVTMEVSGLVTIATNPS